VCRSTLGCHPAKAAPVRRGLSIKITETLDAGSPGQTGRRLASRHGPIRQSLKTLKGSTQLDYIG
jgi:hypothetical protein